MALLTVIGAVGLPDLEGPVIEVSRSLGAWTYLVVGVFAFFETAAFVGLVVPGETAVLAGGVAAHSGGVELVPLIAVVWLAASMGDTTSFMMGRRLGRPFLADQGPRLRLDAARLARVDAFYARHGATAVVAGRFVGVARAVLPFVAGTSAMALRRFVTFSLAGAFLWSALLTTLGYAFSDSIGAAGDAVTRIALAAMLSVAVLLVVRRRIASGGSRRARSGVQPQGCKADDDAQRAAHRGARDDVEREVDAQVQARQRDGERERERGPAQARAQHGDRSRGGERRAGVAGGKRGAVGRADERRERSVLRRRTSSVNDALEDVDDDRCAEHGCGGGGEGDRPPPLAKIGAQRDRDEQRALDPPRREDDEDDGEGGMLKTDGLIDQSVIKGEHQSSGGEARPWRATTSGAPAHVHASNRPGAVLVVINGRASRVAAGQPRLLDEITAGLRAQRLRVDARVTHSETELGALLEAADGRRVVLVGGDGSLHAAANVALDALPEVALIPAGRANNIARALGIPTDLRQAVTLATRAPAQPVDVLHVQTPQRAVYALEALSAGFHAAARSRYAAANSGDLRQGVRLLAGSIARYAPCRADVRLDDREIEVPAAAQLFLSNLPFFGFGFEINPRADPSDGFFEAVLIEAGSRRELLAQLVAAHRGRHIGRRGVQRIAVRHAELTRALPLVADTVWLGTTTATIRIEPARLRIASPPASRAV